MVAPARAFGGDFDRCWLLAVQLYGVRSARNWGMGDFTDLEGLIELAHHLGADGVGLNPLHALFDDRPGDCSPYSPNSRLFLNALYIDVEKLPEFRANAGTEGCAGALAGLRRRRLSGRGRAEMAGAALGFRHLQGQSKRSSVDRISKNSAPSARRLLSRFACFEVSPAQVRRSPGGNGRKSGSSRTMPGCARLREGSRCSRGRVRRIRAMERRPAACRLQGELAHRLGMKVGLYLDVAVGVQSDGFDAWNEQAAISRHLGVGAPPDPLEYRRPGLGPRRLQRRRSRNQIVRALSARCCGPRCAMPARSGSITCWA